MPHDWLGWELGSEGSLPSYLSPLRDLGQVGDNVDDVKVNTHNISSRVSMLDNKMAEVRDGMNNVQQVRTGGVD